MDKKKAIIVAIVIIAIAGVVSMMYISANSHNTKIEVLNNNTLKNGDFIQIQLTDEYRNVYPGENVDIKILDDSGWGDKFNVITDENGIGSMALVGYENGNYTVYCNYNGTLFNKESRSITSLAIDDGYGF